MMTNRQKTSNHSSESLKKAQLRELVTGDKGKEPDRKYMDWLYPEQFHKTSKK